MKKFIYLSLASSVLLASLALPALAQQSTSTAGSATSTRSGFSSSQLACVQTAVRTREGALQTAWSIYSSAVSSALSARASALNSGWGMSNRTARVKAIRKAWKDYATSARSARSAYRGAKRSAWSAFYSARKACGVTSSESDVDNGAE